MTRLTVLAKLFVLLILLLPPYMSVSAQTKTSFRYDGKPIHLKGEWDFYWQQHLTPAQLDTTLAEVVTLPAYWKNHEQISPQLPAFGLATYSTTLYSDTDQQVALRYTAAHCAQKIFVNGQLVEETGVLGTDADSNQPNWLPGVTMMQLRAGPNVIIMQVANFEHSKGGIFNALTVGPRAIVFSQYNRQVFIESFIIGSLLVLGLFFLALFALWHRDRKFLYYGIFAFSFGIWYGGFGMHVFRLLLPDLSWYYTTRVTYIALYVALMFMQLFLRSTYKELMNIWFQRFFVSYLLIHILIVLFTPPYFFTRLLMMVHVVGLMGLLYNLVAAVISISRRQRGFTLIALANFSFVLAIFILFGIFHKVIWLDHEISAWLFLTTFFLYAITLARHIETAFFAVDQLQRETKLQKDQIEQQARKLRRLDQFKSRFFANISHDFRSPLTLIIGYLDLFKREDNYLTEASEESLAKVTTNVNKLVRLTDEIRDLIRLEEGKIALRFRKMEIARHVSALVQMFEATAEANGIRLKVSTSLPSGVIVHYDPNHIEKVVYNLVSNAIKYIGNGDEIHVHIGRSGYADQEMICIEVIDNGRGISEEELPYVFDRFYQSSHQDQSAKEGLGIGLSLVKELIELHHGQITIESQLNVGTNLRVFLPYNLSERAEEASYETSYMASCMESATTLPKVPASGKSIAADFEGNHRSDVPIVLVVDDHEAVRGYISSVINTGRTVLQAANGKEALEILHKQKVDLVITDLMMPWMDGFGLIEAMKASDQLQHLPVMVVSARYTEEDVHRVLSYGVSDYLCKPFDAVEFNQRIDNLLQIRTDQWDELALKNGKQSDLERNLLGKINELIIENIDDSKLKVANLADMLAASERSVFRIIKELTGMPPKSYIQKVRMDYAESLLRKRRVKSVTELGKAIGMNNVTEFVRQFKKEKEYHPREYLEV